MRKFITNNKDYITFQNKERCVKREVIETTFTEKAFSNEKTDLTTIVRTELTNLRQKKLSDKKGQYDIRCLCIQVEKDDGMTWAAESVNVTLETYYPEFASWKKLLKGYGHDGLPLISQLLSEKEVRKILKKHLLAKEISYLTIMIPLAIAISAIVVNILINLSTDQNLSFSNLIKHFKDPNFWGLFCIVLLITLIISHLTSRLNEKSEKTDDKIKKQLEEDNNGNTDTFNKIVGLLSQKIRPFQFRVIIIDNFSELDKTTRKVIEKYLLTYERAGASEFWIIFDNKKSGHHNFNNFVLNNQGNWIFKTRTKTFDLKHISSKQKRDLINLLKLPEEAENYRLIKTICNGKITDSNWNMERLSKYRQAHPKNPDIYKEFELFFLLSLLSSPAKMYFSKKNFIDILSVKGKLRSAVLEKFLYNTKFSGSEFREKLNKIFPEKQEPESTGIIFPDLIESRQTEGSTGYSIVPEIKYSLINNSEELVLPSPEIGNLFWSLYWGDNRHYWK